MVQTLCELSMLETENTTKCPYCGGEIEQGVRKCKHCGEWLVPDTGQSIGVNAASADEGKRNKRHHHYGCLISLLLVVALMIGAAVSVPSKREHREKINEALADYARTYASKTLQEQGNLSSMIGQLLMGQDALMQYVIDSYVETEIKNYGLFSLGYVKLKSGGERKLVSIGALGEVFILADYTDLPLEELSGSKKSEH